jgi:hypothetical protein
MESKTQCPKCGRDITGIIEHNCPRYVGAGMALLFGAGDEPATEPATDEE